MPCIKIQNRFYFRRARQIIFIFGRNSAGVTPLRENLKGERDLIYFYSDCLFDAITDFNFSFLQTLISYVLNLPVYSSKAPGFDLASCESFFLSIDAEKQ